MKIKAMAIIVAAAGAVLLASPKRAEASALFGCGVCSDSCWSATFGCMMICLDGGNGCQAETCTGQSGQTYRYFMSCG